ncbi:GNAT family N-acetyltransferase [Macrococcus sp. DPC7161]|uniref:GNAT family N-acetyltransferase n=1 Tax=Macrococcus sp. DPC7161 TaxID=2507060 RepID=UPI00100AC413|nr:GNAT family N-acetyltransferase [Macrococcus sp. DPC7161]RXK17506.1 N-acetyltransferase [Macrococcus sp. DPC7161]
MNEIQHIDKQFIIGEIEHPKAFLSYFESGDKEISIDHTVVSPELRGQGIAKQLVDEAVKYAKAHDLKIVPICSYVRKVIEATPEYHDVLVK